MKASDLPTWKNMPAVKGMPHGIAWGLFDASSGSKDEIGTLNLLTQDVVVAARSEIQTGRSVALNWGMEKLHQPGFNRTSLQHKFVDWRVKARESGGPEFFSYDDEITVNTQAGSQWDGLRHWGHQPTGFYYNGLHHDDVLKGTHLGIDHWTKRGGIVGRGILFDYVEYATRHNIQFNPMSRHPITLSDLKTIAKECNITPRPGDILLVRTGWVQWYEEHSVEERIEYVTNGKAWIGVEGSEESLEWIWDNHFAAVAADSIGFECWPPQEPWKMHDFLLAGWGCPIGEMWDLENLAQECSKQKRWSFFLTSSPLNTKGGVATPPNAIAIF